MFFGRNVLNTGPGVSGQTFSFNDPTVSKEMRKPSPFTVARRFEKSVETEIPLLSPLRRKETFSKVRVAEV